MFLLQGDGPVDSPAQLQSRLTAGLGTLVSMERTEPRITIHGEWPALELVSLALTGAHVNAQSPPPLPGRAPTIERRFTARKFEVVARPLYVGTAAQVRLELEAEQVELSLLRDGRGLRWMGLTRVGHGSANLDLGESQLEQMFFEVAAHLAANHGVKVEVGRLTLTQPAADTLGIQTLVTARKAFLKGTVAISGRVRVDQSLQLHLSDVACTGQGVVGAMAAPLLQSFLERHQADSLPMLGHTFTELRCDRIQLELGKSGALRVAAALSS